MDIIFSFVDGKDYVLRNIDDEEYERLRNSITETQHRFFTISDPDGVKQLTINLNNVIAIARE